MLDVLQGRDEPPIDNGEMTLHEVASGYYARAMEIQMLLHRAEQDGTVLRSSRAYKFRTGELRDFIDIAKNACELGSRRVTWAQISQEARYG